MRRFLICAVISPGLYPRMKTTTPGSIGGNEGGHRLAEHVAERQEVQKANRRKWPAPLAVLHDFAFDRHDVREDVAVGDDDAFGLGRRAGREDDLRHVVAPTAERQARPGEERVGPSAQSSSCSFQMGMPDA